MMTDKERFGYADELHNAIVDNDTSWAFVCARTLAEDLKEELRKKKELKETIKKVGNKK